MESSVEMQQTVVMQSSQGPHNITTLLLDCDNTLTLTEEHAFTATAQTINTLLADFKIPRQTSSTNGLLTESALHALDAENLSRTQRQDHGLEPNNDTTLPLASDQTLVSNDNKSDSDSDPGSTSSKPSKYASYSSASLLADYIGLPFRQILASILSRHNLTLTPEQSKHYQRLEEANVNRQISQFSQAATDVLQTLLTVRSRRTFNHIAVVSSSPLPRIKVALTKTGLYPASAFFSDPVLFSACDSLPVPIHKPSPAIYLHAVKELDVDAASCLAVEDSVSGCLAAVKAGIRCLGFVGAYHDPGKRDMMRKVLLANGAGAVMGAWNEFDACLAVMQGIPSPIAGSGPGPATVLLPAASTAGPGYSSSSGSSLASGAASLTGPCNE